MTGFKGTEPRADAMAKPTTDHYIWPLMTRAEIAEDGGFVFAHGNGSHVTDIHGRQFLDMSSAVSRAMSFGYSNGRIVDAVADQLARLPYAGQGEYQADVVMRLAARLADISPDQLNAVYFTESGTSANESAIKLAKLYQRVSGKPRAYKVISRWTAYHGSIGTPMAASDWLGVRLPVEPGTPGVSLVPAPTCYRSPFGHGEPLPTDFFIDALEAEILQQDPSLVTAFIAEPVMQANGVQIPPDDYFPRVRELCDEYGILLIADEVITGFGRTGEMFGMSHWGVVPDIVTMAKSITAGYAPLGAVCAQQWIYDALDVFPDVHTFGGHPIAARAALEVIDILEEGGIDQARSTGTHLQLALELVTRHDIVGETRGIGMWAAIDFTLDRTTRAPMPRETVRRILRRTRELGVILTSNGSALEFAPRLDAPTDEIDHGVEVFDQAIADVASTL